MVILRALLIIIKLPSINNVYLALGKRLNNLHLVGIKTSNHFLFRNIATNSSGQVWFERKTPVYNKSDTNEPRVSHNTKQYSQTF